MKEIIYKAIRAACAGLLAIYLMAAPFSGAAFAATEPVAAVKDYDMNEYLSTLATTGQVEKNDRIINIANNQAWQQRTVWYQEWSKGHAIVYGSDPVGLVMARAEAYGFDADQDSFLLHSQGGKQAVVKVTHDGRDYHVELEQNSKGYWFVKRVN